MEKYKDINFEVDYFRSVIFTKEPIDLDKINFSKLKEISENEEIIKFEVESEKRTREGSIYIFSLSENKKIEFKTHSKHVEVKFHFLLSDQYLSFNNIIKELGRFINILDDFIISLKDKSIFRLAIGMSLVIETESHFDYFKKIETFIPSIAVKNKDEIDLLEVKIHKKTRIPKFNNIYLNKVIQCSPSQLVKVNSENNMETLIKEVALIRFDYNTENKQANVFSEPLDILHEIKNIISQ